MVIRADPLYSNPGREAGIEWNSIRFPCDETKTAHSVRVLFFASFATFCSKPKNNSQKFAEDAKKFVRDDWRRTHELRIVRPIEIE